MHSLYRSLLLQIRKTAASHRAIMVAPCPREGMFCLPLAQLRLPSHLKEVQLCCLQFLVLLSPKRKLRRRHSVNCSPCNQQGIAELELAPIDTNLHNDSQCERLLSAQASRRQQLGLQSDSTSCTVACISVPSSLRNWQMSCPLGTSSTLAARSSCLASYSIHRKSRL